MFSTIGKAHTHALPHLLDPLCTLAKLCDAFWQLAGQRIEKVSPVHRGLANALCNAAAQILRITPIAPLEPHVLPRRWGAVGNLAIGFGDAQPSNGTHGIGTKRHARPHFTKRGGRFEQLDVQMRMAAKIERKCDTCDTTTDNRNFKRSSVMHCKVPRG
ncbi:hypothetical protein D3C80_1666130 [compost metagenome]